MSPNKKNITMGKSSHFFGQPVYGQLVKSIEREKILEISRKHGGEKRVESKYTRLSMQTRVYTVT